MNAKSLLLRARLRALARRLLLAGLIGWAAFGWITGRVDVVGGTHNVIAYIQSKLHKDKSVTDVVAVATVPQDIAAAKAATAAREAGLLPAVKPQAPEIALAYPANDVLCLAHAVYFEAGREPQEIQAAIAKVALNRVRAMQGPKSICKIVYLGLGRPMGCLFRNTCRNLGVIPDDEALWKAAMLTAQQAAQRRPPEDMSSDFSAATHFHGSGPRPAWVRQVYRLAQKGKFVFYSSEPVETAETAMDVAGRSGLPRGKPRSAAVTTTTDSGATVVRKAAATTTQGALADQKPRGRSAAAESSRSPFGDRF